MNFTHLYSQLMLVLYISTIFLMNFLLQPVLLPLYILLRPFNRNLYRKIITCTQYTIGSTLCFMNRFWVTSDIKLYMDKNDREYLGKEKALLIMNHSCEVDWMFVNTLSEQFNTLGNLKYFIKKTVQYIPIVGSGFIMHDFIMLERSFAKDKRNIYNGVKELSDFPNAIWNI